MPVNHLHKLAIQKRRHQVADMYLRCWTQTAIAEQLGIKQPTVCTDLKWVRREWLKSTIRDFDEARAIELQKIDRVEREAWAAWERSQKPSQAAVTTDDGPQKRVRRSMKNQHGDPRFLDLVHKCIAQRRAILGLDLLPPQAESNGDVIISLEARRDRVIGIFAALRDRERTAPIGAGPGLTLTGDVRRLDEPGEMEIGQTPGPA